MRLLIAIVFSLLTSYLCAQSNVAIASGSFDGEPFLAINPTNPKNIVIAWMHITPATRPIRTRASFDGGLTWQAPVDLPIVYSNTADPTMAFDKNGNLHLCFIDHLGTSSTSNDGGIYSYKSTDGGLTWGNQAFVIGINADGLHQPIDRPWLVCDKSNGVHSGNLYLTTKTVSGGPTPYHPYFMKSTNGGNSWSTWKYVDTTGWLSEIPSTYASPVVTANGIFVGLYPSYVPSQSPLPKYIMAYSNTGGDSFNYKSAVTYIPNASNDSAKRGWQLVANPANENHLAFLFVSGNSGDLDILFSESLDFGNTWSAVQRVNTDASGNGILQDLVWGSFDTDGDFVVCWRDRINSNGTGYARASQIVGAVKWKDSANFSIGFEVSDSLVPYNNILSQSGNDFLCQQMYEDTLYITWGDARTGFLNIWFDKIALKTGNSTGLTKVASSEVSFPEIYPNPSSDMVQIDVPLDKLKSIQVYDVLGVLIATELTNRFSVADFTSGKYFLLIETTDGVGVKQLIKN